MNTAAVQIPKAAQSLADAAKAAGYDVKIDAIPSLVEVLVETETKTVRAVWTTNNYAVTAYAMPLRFDWATVHPKRPGRRTYDLHTVKSVRHALSL